MKWNIVADSSCDLKQADVSCQEVSFSTVPFILHIDEQEFVDDEALDVLGMMEFMENCPTASSTACPSPDAWITEFNKADNSIAITISSNLSGSYGSAVVGKNLAQAEHPDKNIFVLDSKSTGPETAMCIRKMVQWIKAGHNIAEVVEKSQAFLDKTKTVFALSSFDNLVKSGRMKKITGFIARTFGMWGIGVASEEGTIAVKGVTRGQVKAIDRIMLDMVERNFSGEDVTISHCQNESMARQLRDAIRKRWATACVTILKTRGLDSYYAERGGLIVAYN